MFYSMVMVGKGFLSGMKFGLLGVVLDFIYGRLGLFKWWGGGGGGGFFFIILFIYCCFLFLFKLI